MKEKLKVEMAIPTPAKLATLQNILGEGVVFLPIPKGEKGPCIKQWTEIQIDSMSSLTYLSRFEDDINIGVMTGTPSNQLLAIDIDTYGDEELNLFLELNPALRETATVVGEKGAKIFVRADRSASSGKIKNEAGEDVGDFLADGKQAVVHRRSFTRSRRSLEVVNTDLLALFILRIFLYQYIGAECFSRFILNVLRQYTGRNQIVSYISSIILRIR